MNEGKERLAINGGNPVRSRMLPYGKQWISREDISAVTDVLESDWLTTGPKVEAFEKVLAETTGSRYAVVVSNGTAALHAAMYAAGIKPGDEVIVPPMTFAATANSVVFQQGKPVFADVNAENLLIDPDSVLEKICTKTKAIIAVDYAGHPCDYKELKEISDDHNLLLIDDCCHALGGKYHQAPVGSLADMNIFSFHPVKHITTGEGGAVTTDNPEFAKKMKLFRGHGITSDFHQREAKGSWLYEMTDLGYNYRLSDIQCALGISQIRHLSDWICRRQQIAERYCRELNAIPGIKPLITRDYVSHAYHLYVVRVDSDLLQTDRLSVFSALRAEGIGVNVHYIPVHLHPYYIKNFNTYEGLCPVAEREYQKIISLPIFPQMSKSDEMDVMAAVKKVSDAYS